LARAADKRDTLAIARTIAFADRQSTGATTSELREWRYIAGLGRAYASLARGDSIEAEHAFVALQDSLAWYSLTTPVVLDAARLFTKLGHAREALSLLDRHPSPSAAVSAWKPRWYLEVARAAATTGDVPRSRASYAYAAAAWSHADPPLRRELEDCAADLRRHGIR